MSSIVEHVARATLKQISYYKYVPSKNAAIVFAVLYSVAFAATLLQFMRYRSWVWLTMLLSAAMEAGGYIARIISVNDVYSKNVYIVQFSLIVLAPVLMAAACYIVFGRIVFHVVPKEARTTRLLWIPPRFITPIFVFCDIVALLLQLFGAVKITSIDPSDPDLAKKAKQGKKIAQIGVAVQLICFGLFTIIAVRFNFTSKRFAASFNERLSGTGEKYCTIDGSEKKLKRNWQAILRVTNLASFLILIRSVYRMVDFSLGRTGYTTTHEWCMYVLDAAVIYPVVTLFIWWHPSKYLPYLGFRLPKNAR